MSEIKLYIAELETRNFRFQAVGSSGSLSALALKKTFESHIKKHEGTLTWEDVVDDLYIQEIQLDKGWVS
jgi:hypothetical protein